MNIVIIGCGLIGRKRALALEQSDKLIACCDVNEELALKFSQEFKCSYFTDFNKLLKEIECDSVIVAVTNKYIEEIVKNSIELGRHIISEKPLGRNYSESDRIIKCLENYRKELNTFIQLKTGFNHRFHPAIWKAKELVDENEIGKIFSIRARYGHGGRPGMENEWRASKDLCGGGELLDQGVHVIDLTRWFGGDFNEVYANVETKFWNMEVEDNAMAMIKTVNGISASLIVSWTNWKNIFSFEIFGTQGYLKIEGLGGSYGTETLEYGKRNEKGGRPEVQFFEFSGEDVSWKNEWKEFKSSVEEKRECIGSGYDGLKANLIIEAMYKSSIDKKTVML